MNWKESRHLCRWLGQTLIYRQVNYDNEDVVCEADEEEWPEF